MGEGSARVNSSQLQATADFSSSRTTNQYRMATKKKVGEEVLSRANLKSAIWYTVTKLVEEEEITLEVAASEHFVAVLSEMVFTQALGLGKDLESFARHAGRTTIGVEDVKLAARRNEMLYQLICTEATRHGLSVESLKEKKAKPKPKASTSAAKKKEKAKEDDLGADESDDSGDKPPVKKKKKVAAKKGKDDSDED